jgi:hypothetical protein
MQWGSQAQSGGPLGFRLYQDCMRMCNDTLEVAKVASMCARVIWRGQSSDCLGNGKYQYLLTLLLYLSASNYFR